MYQTFKRTFKFTLIKRFYFCFNRYYKSKVYVKLYLNDSFAF